MGCGRERGAGADIRPDVHALALANRLTAVPFSFILLYYVLCTHKCSEEYVQQCYNGGT